MAAAIALVSRAEQAPIDATCAGICASFARRKLHEAWPASEAGGDASLAAEAGRAAALATAVAALDEAIRVAIERHDQVDEDGDPVECRGLQEVLSPASREAVMPSPEALAVAAAFDAARSEGRTEIEAAERSGAM